MGKDANHRGVAVQKTRFARLDHEMLSSAAYRALTTNARALLAELAMIYNLKNNGEIYLSVRDAADRMGVSDLNAATNAFTELMKLGFVDIVAAATFSSRPDRLSKARCWRLTWLAAAGSPATFEYRDVVIVGRHAQRRATAGRRALQKLANGNNRGAKSNTETGLPVLESITLTENCRGEDPITVAKSNTGNSQKPPISVESDRIGFRYTSRLATTDGDLGQPDVLAKGSGLAAAPALPAAQTDDLRQDLDAHLTAEGHGAQATLSLGSGVPAPIISKFRNGGSLPTKYFVPLRMAVAARAAPKTRRAA